MPFCSKCGKPLADGENCSCQNSTNNISTPDAVTDEQPEFKFPDAEPVTADIEAADAEPVTTGIEAAPATEQPDVQETNDATQSLVYATPNKKNNKTVFKIIMGIVAVGIVAIIVLLISNLFGGSKNPIDELLKSINSQETDATVLLDKAFPDFVSDDLNTMLNILVKTDEYEDTLEDLSDALDDMYDAIKDEYGKNWSLSFDAKETELDKNELNDIAELYEDFYSDYLEDLYDELEDLDDDDIEDLADEWELSEKDAKKFINAMSSLISSFENIKVTDGYELKGKFVFTSKNDESKTSKYTINIIKLNGEWTIDYLSLLDELGLSIDYLLFYLSYY